MDKETERVKREMEIVGERMTQQTKSRIESRRKSLEDMSESLSNSAKASQASGGSGCAVVIVSGGALLAILRTWL